MFPFGTQWFEVSIRSSLILFSFLLRPSFGRRISTPRFLLFSVIKVNGAALNLFFIPRPLGVLNKTVHRGFAYKNVPLV